MTFGTVKCHRNPVGKFTVQWGLVNKKGRDRRKR